MRETATNVEGPTNGTMGSKHVLGSCGVCGGTVSVPLAWWGLTPPEPTCESCGRRAKPPKLPIIEMEP